MKDRLSNEAVARICEGSTLYYLPVHVGFAGMALLGMKRHAMYTPDWVAHSCLFDETVVRIKEVLADEGATQIVLSRLESEVETAQGEA